MPALAATNVTVRAAADEAHQVTAGTRRTDRHSAPPRGVRLDHRPMAAGRETGGPELTTRQRQAQVTPQHVGDEAGAVPVTRAARGAAVHVPLPLVPQRVRRDLIPGHHPGRARQPHGWSTISHPTVAVSARFREVIANPVPGVLDDT